ncbi:immunity 49 family protein [Nocardiopsis salina]|uniref:immunity 49 family protein n=1 Tax=Nocardiopsis salina TaxID=245836 RepID=UPI00068727BC|nr:immunity 49 family protein [Nocardiopsis salina]
MKFEIPRHHVNKGVNPKLWDKSSDNREFWTSRVADGKRGIYRGMSTLWFDVILGVHADPHAEWLETWEAFASAMQLHHAVLMLYYYPPGEEREFMVNHEVRSSSTLGPHFALNASNWTQALFLAVVCRDHARVEELCEIPVEVLREAGESDGAEYNPFTYHWVGALQAFVKGRPQEFGRELLAAMELSQPDRVEFGDADVLNQVVFPPMDVLLRLTERDSAAFNESLARALESYREYQTSDPERKDDKEGLLPLSLLAIACWAWDLAASDDEFSFDVVSGYLPKHLLEGSWRGEFAI